MQYYEETIPWSPQAPSFTLSAAKFDIHILSYARVREGSMERVLIVTILCYDTASILHTLCLQALPLTSSVFAVPRAVPLRPLRPGLPAPVPLRERRQLRPRGRRLLLPPGSVDITYTAVKNIFSYMKNICRLARRVV